MNRIDRVQLVNYEVKYKSSEEHLPVAITSASQASENLTRKASQLKEKVSC